MESLKASTDVELIALLNQDSQAAFTEVYRRYFDALYVHAKKMTHGDDGAADLVQDVFANIWIKRRELTGSSPSALKYYLYTSVKHAVLNDRRKAMNFERNLDDFTAFMATVAAPADQALLAKQLEALIESEIQALPDRVREVYQFRKEQDMSLDEIAQRLGVSKNTVKSQLNTAIQRLRKKLTMFFIALIIISLG